MRPTDSPSVPQRTGAILTIGLLAVMGACSAATSSSPSASEIVHPMGAGDLVLRYEETGGFAGPQTILGRYPALSVYGDGTVITTGPVDAIYPGPALPNLIATRLTEAGLQRLLAAAAVAGLLGPDAHFDATGIADATTAEFTLVAAGSRHVLTAYALGLGTPEMEGSAANVAARARLRAFSQVLGDLRRTLGADIVSPDAPYAYNALRVLVANGSPQTSDPGVARPPLAWPLRTPLATFGAAGTGAAVNYRCGVVSGADLELLRPLLAQATQITSWKSAGSLYTVLPLPMLPDEAGC